MRAIIFAALYFAAAWAIADQAVVKVYSLAVQEPLENLELIDVNAKQAPATDAGALDEDLAEILREVEAVKRTSARDRQ